MIIISLADNLFHYFQVKILCTTAEKRSSWYKAPQRWKNVHHTPLCLRSNKSQKAALASFRDAGRLHYTQISFRAFNLFPNQGIHNSKSDGK